MVQRIYFLRHAETRYNTNLPVTEWILTEAGLERARNLAATEVFADIDSIIASPEQKAIQTAEPFADRLDLEIHHNARFRELERRGSSNRTQQEYEAHVKEALLKPCDSIAGWESAMEALARFLEGVKELGKSGSPCSVLVVSHGLVLSLYFAYKLNLMPQVYERWKMLQFLSWGMKVGDGIARDIVQG